MTLVRTSWLLLCAYTLFLAACGGGGSSMPAAPIPPPPDPNLINGIRVPPDPGPAGTATVAGMDSDANGIRDDIDRFIATKYGTNAKAMMAAQASALAAQKVLTADATNQTAARIALEDSSDAGVCAGRGFRTAGLDSSQELNELHLRIHNTPQRLHQHQAIVATAGLFTRNLTAVVCP
jgi:hypothetical protein